jgi:hypothetical protein
MRVIEQLLKDIALATTGVQYYGRGGREYANIESPKYPRIWVHMINPIDTLHQNGLITSTYDVVAEVSTLIDFTKDLGNSLDGIDEYMTKLEEMQTIYFEYITRLQKDARNMLPIGKISRKEFYHDFDDNLVGYAFNFNITVKETIVYPCLT